MTNQEWLEQNNAKIQEIQQTLANKTNFSEVDPTVPEWAKQPSKPTYKYSEIEETPTGLATETFVRNEIANAQLGGDDSDIDLSGYATKDELNTKADKSELNNYVTNEALTNKGYLTSVPSDYKTKTENDALYQAKGNYLTSIPSEYITETELTGKGYATTTDVQNAVKDKATTNYVDTKVANLVNSAPETLDTLGEVATAIQNNASVVDALNSAIGNKVDKVSGKGLSTNDYTTEEKNKLSGLSNYNDTEVRNLISGKADKSAIPTKVSQLTNDSNYLTSIPSEYVTETELSGKGYLTSTDKQEIKDYVDGIIYGIEEALAEI